jgi:DNA-binding response OmpR family regulator
MGRVLIADDSETILLLMRTRLEMEGYEVVTAADGVEVIELMQRDSEPAPDILLLDAMMPRKSGIDALRELRAAGVEIPALIVSAHREADGDGDDELGIGGHIGKPIDFAALFERIAELTKPGPA